MIVVGIGVDAEPIASFRRKQLPKDRAFFERVFSKEEIAYCKKFRDSAPHFTARFCAKEAVVKAVRPSFPIRITDCEIVNHDDGAPFFKARSQRESFAKFLAKHQLLISLSHTEELAIAFAVLLKVAHYK